MAMTRPMMACGVCDWMSVRLRLMKKPALRPLSSISVIVSA